MENFFVDDRFYSGLEDLIEDVLDWEEIDEIKELNDDWSIEVTESSLEPMIRFDINWILNRIDDDRLPEDCERTDRKLVQLLKDNINFDAINAGMPELYYEKWNSKIKITKQDLMI
jgi:hypothetical protein